MIEDGHIASNLKKNNLFILIFPKEIEEGNNNSNTNTDNSFIKASTTSPLPSEYREYIDIFFKSEARQLPNHVLIKYAINTGNVEFLYRLIYNLSANELNTLRDNLEELLKKGYIQQSTSPADTPILFIPKKDKNLRIYVDYRELNKITKKNRHLLSFIGETLDRLQKTTIFTKLNIRDTYHKIKIRKGDE